MKDVSRTLAILILTTLISACGQQGTVDGNPFAGASSSSEKALVTKEALEQKAVAGDSDSQFELGALYHDGEGVVKDLAKAKSWFEKAAAQGDARAQFNLGVMYYVGEGVKQNYTSAKQWFQKAVDQGNSRAQFNLGVMYYRGEGMEVDLKKAYTLFTNAAMQGFGEAQFNLGVMEAKGEGKVADITKAYAWFTLAKERGNIRASEVITTIEERVSKAELAVIQKAAQDLKAVVEANIKDMSAKANLSDEQ